jgi:hypothetical protein
MDRIYKQGKTNDAKYFVADEVERTPLYGMRTLFVVGVQPVNEIVSKALEFKCPAVYFGTGNSFSPAGYDDAEYYNTWDRMISDVMEHDLWATLDFDVKHCDGVLEMVCAENRRFVPMIAVKMPYVRQFNYNATLKIDDVDFDKSNPGVWCWSLEDLLKRDHFSDWEQYRNDTIIQFNDEGTK